MDVFWHQHCRSLIAFFPWAKLVMLQVHIDTQTRADLSTIQFKIEKETFTISQVIRKQTQHVNIINVNCKIVHIDEIQLVGSEDISILPPRARGSHAQTFFPPIKKMSFRQYSNRLIRLKQDFPVSNSFYLFLYPAFPVLILNCVPKSVHMEGQPWM